MSLKLYNATCTSVDYNMLVIYITATGRHVHGT